MADSIQNRRNQQTYLRQIQQEKAEKKREILNAQKEDLKSVRDYYADQNKQLDNESAAAVNHIKEESRQLAQAERIERENKIQAEADQKRITREEAAASRTENAKQTSTPDQSVEKKNSTRVTPSKSL